MCSPVGRIKFLQGDIPLLVAQQPTRQLSAGRGGAHDGKSKFEKPPCLSLCSPGRHRSCYAAAARLSGGAPLRLALSILSFCHIHRAVYGVGHFRPQADHPVPGAPLSRCHIRTDGILGNCQNDPLYHRGRSLGTAPPLVSVLYAYAVHPDAGGVRRIVIGKAGELPPAELDETYLHTNHRAVSAGADQ